MAYSFQQAVRKPTNLLLGLAGPTGAGKTYSALLLATGIVQVTGGNIAFIDTERGRALQYAPDGTGYQGFEFLHQELQAPYSSERYGEILEAAEKAAGAAGVVVIDSMSHEHEGPGGLLEQHDAEVDRRAGNDWAKRERVSLAAWAKPKQQRRTLINRILQAQCHLIVCYRAKEKVKLIKNAKGKSEIVPVGWQPITGDEFPYEMTIMCLMDDQDKGRPIIEQFERGKCPENLKGLFPTTRKLTKDVGAALAKWSMAGARCEPKRPAEPPADMATPHDPDTGEITEDDPLAGLGGGADEPLPLSFEKARDIAIAIDECQDLTALAEIDNAMHKVMASFRESSQQTLMDKMKARKDELMRERAAA
jgi:hypothetical protein